MAAARRRSGRTVIALYRILFLIGLIGVWFVLSNEVSRNLIPSPYETLLAAQKLIANGSLLAGLGDSMLVFGTGYLVAVAVAIPLGLLMGGFRPFGKTVDIFVYALAATPRVAFIPLIIVFLGLGLQAKVFIVFLGALMPVLINTYTGVLSADAELVEMGRSLGARRLSVFRRIILPGALPFIVSGLRIGATIGLINTVVAELYTAVRGLGGMLATYGNTFRMAEYFVIVIVFALIGVTVNEALRLLEARLSRWRTQS